jgi:cysteine desulfurase
MEVAVNDEDKMIYLDHAATTAVDPRVVEAMLPYWTRKYGNASSIYKLGRQSHQALDGARQTVADILHAKPEEIVFTGCGSESDNLAIRGTAWASRQKGNHIITSPIEHHAVRDHLSASGQVWRGGPGRCGAGHHRQDRAGDHHVCQ